MQHAWHLEAMGEARTIFAAATAAATPAAAAAVALEEVDAAKVDAAEAVTLKEKREYAANIKALESIARKRAKQKATGDPVVQAFWEAQIVGHAEQHGLSRYIAGLIPHVVAVAAANAASF